jgi:hypothetical protein
VEVACDDLAAVGQLTVPSKRMLLVKAPPTSSMAEMIEVVDG